MNNYNFKVLLGYLKDTAKKVPVYLKGFSWNCGWYWGGGYIGNQDMHCHFDGCFLDVPDVRGHPLGNFITPWSPKMVGAKVIDNGAATWESLGFFLDEPQYSPEQWWRIKDLYKQFYALRDAAEVLQIGGHCCACHGPGEINKELAAKLNKQIELVIIPEIIKALKVEEVGL